MLLALLVFTFGCSSGIDRDHYRRLDRSLAAGRYEHLPDRIKDAGRQVYGDKNRLLYHMDMAMANHLAGRFEESIRHCRNANRVGDDLYTRSVSSEVGSLFTSDLDLPYRGEDSERVMVHLLAALGHACLAQVDGALVEVRRANSRLRELIDGGAGGRYRDDGFARLLGTLLFMQAGDWDDGIVALRKAWDAYLEYQRLWGLAPPEVLSELAAELAWRTGDEDLPGLEDNAPLVGPPAGTGSLNLVVLVGPGPRKVERVFQIALGRGMVFVRSAEIRGEDSRRAQTALSAAAGLASHTQVVVAYPVFEQPAISARGARVEVEGCGGREVEPVEEVSEIARTNLEDRVQRDRGRMIARAVLKFLAARAAGRIGRRHGNPLVGAIAHAVAQAAMSATEAADIRSWRTLPARIHLARLHCPAGRRDVRVHLSGGSSGGDLLVAPQVEFAPGKTTWLTMGSW